MTTATATVSLSAVMTAAWASARAAAARFDGKSRHFFRAALATAWADARKPAEMRFPIIKKGRFDEYRKDGSPMVVNMTCQTECGAMILGGRTNVDTKLHAGNAHEMRIENGCLVLSGGMLARNLERIEDAKAQFENETAGMDALEKGLMRFGNLWQKGAHRRIYFDIDLICEAAGFACGYYGTGNMSWAMQDGKHISNNDGRYVLSRLQAAKIHYDLVAREWSCMDTISDAKWDRIRDAFTARAET